ncbi:unnamed protein product [Schistosoma bovis]|nr:unnamed protein product [Schistosoma bovis]
MDKDNHHRNKIEGFSCKTAGLETPKIPLTLVKPNDIQLNTMDLSKTKTSSSSSSSSNSHSMISHLNKTISNEYNTQKDESNPLNNGMNQSIKRINSELKAALTREVLIIGAIIIVFISVILNVFCCIRCALIRQYSKSKDRPHMQHLFCMAEEIRNARIVKQINGKGFNYRDKVGYEQQQQQHLGTLLHDGHKMNKKGSSLLLMNKIQSQSNGYESYQPSIDYGSEYLTGLNCPGFLLNDNQSSNGLSSDIHLRYLPDGKSGNRQSISAFSIVPGQFPISWTHHNNSNSNIEAHRRSITSIQRNGGNSLASHHSSQQQITEAVTNFYLQHQQHFKELQNHLNNTNTTNTTTNNNSNIDTVTMNQLGSDGMNSCFGSIGQPDSSILSDININPSNAMNCESPIMNRHNNDNHIILNNIMPLTNSSMNPSNYIIPIDSINPLINNYTNQLTPNINRIQPIGSSQSQLITLMNKLNYTTNTTNNTTNNQSVHNEQILTHLSTLSDTLNSQSDSGAGSGSGKISMDSSENKINSF